MSDIGMLLKAVDSTPGSVLMKSRMHCHARNVSSIVLRDRSGSLDRVFLTWPCHRLGDNQLGGHLEVGIHDHQYDLTIKLAAGDVQNITYRRDPSGTSLIEWRFESGVESGKPKIDLIGRAGLVESSRVQLHQDFLLSICSDTLHAVRCRGMAAWYVYEGQRHSKWSTLFTHDSEIRTDGLYVKFSSPGDVISHVRNWAAEYGS